MKQTTFENEDVIQLLNTRFIPIRVDSEVQIDIAKDYGVKGLPNSWFLGADAGPINQLPGYVDGLVFALILNYIESDSFKTMTFREFADDIQKRSPS